MTDFSSPSEAAISGPDRRKGPDAARRRLVAGLGLGMLGAGLTGCATSSSGRRSRSLAPGKRVELLYLADTLESLQPTRIVAPATYLGPPELLGASPWATSQGVATLAGAPGEKWRTYSDPRLAAQRHTAGHGRLAASLERLRESIGPSRSLTLENGQCWNGSGLGHLSHGRVGVAASRLLGSDVRVSSDERVLWPRQTAALYRDYGRPVLGSLAPESTPEGVTSEAHFQRDGVRIAVVGATDPHAFDERRDLDVWYQALAGAVNRAGESADLVVLMADTGSAPARWLAERLPGVDLVLAARGQDFWPGLIDISHRDGGSVPMCLPGSHGSGFYQLSCLSDGNGWRIESRFHPNDDERIEPERGALLQARFETLRAPYAGWLDRRLGTAPDWLWRRDSVGGSWDGLIGDALRADGDLRALLPGLRHDTLVAPGEAITRDHLLRLTGGYPARVVDLSPNTGELKRLVERALDNSLGSPQIIHTNRDLPRLIDTDWTLNYGAGPGERATLNTTGGDWRTFSARPDAPAGEALWQRMERYLQAQGGEPPRPERPRITARYVEGHPGWHPQARLT